MANSKTTKKALLSSALALTMCVAMLIATTFAWFTDTASTGVNKIESGTLKVGLEMLTQNATGEAESWKDAEGETLEFKKASTESGTDVLWEPGCTYELPAVRVVNKGNLAFKYKIAITGATGDTKLLDVIKFTVKFNNEEINLDNWEGMLLPKDKTKANDVEEVLNSSNIVISGHMDENAGNEYQGLSVSGIGITVYATQYTYEYDSYDNKYDLSSMYVFDDYVSVTTEVNSNGQTVIQDKEDNPTITATIPAGSLDNGINELALIKKPTANPDSVKVETGNSALTTDVKIIDTATNQVVTAEGDTYFTIDIQLGKVDLKEFYHKGEKLTKVEEKSDLNGAGQYYYDFNSGIVTFTTKDFSTFTAVFKFAGGDGTGAYPYLIATKGHFAAINDEYKSGKFAYYKIVNSVDTLDLNNVGKVRLYGVFDGNGKTVEVNNSLFYFTYSTSADEVKTTIKNLTVMENQSAGALVGYVNSDVINFKNVKVSGAIEQNWHGAAFVGYGTLSFGSGKDYTLNFENCSCDATIATRNEGGVAILVGHAYQGGNNVLTISLDSATEQNIGKATLRGKATATGYKYYVMSSNSSANGVVVKVDGEEISNAHVTFNAESLGATAPEKTLNGTYTITADANAASIKVQVLSQLTAYNAENEQIKALSGITNTNGTCYNDSVSGNSPVEVFKEVTSVVIEKGLTGSGYPEYTLDDSGKLTIKTNDTENYLTGKVMLGAYQYDENGALISSGTLQIAESTGTPKVGNVTWTVN